MHRTTGLILVVGMIAMATAGFAADPNWRTQPPVTYVLDYGSHHLEDIDGYVAQVALAPPTILHLGKDVVMSHNWGPIAGVGGENQAGGKGDAIRRLTPAETRQHFADLERMVGGLHGVGVRWVMPYICSITLGGSHIRRTGFWEFYDHWDEYLEFGLPPRPELDPADWMQRNPDGSMKATYGVRPDKDEFYPPYEPNMRYAACVNNPGWRTWIDTVARLIAAVGYDGAFIDNGGTQECYCRFCQAKYQDWLRGRYVDEEIERLFGVGAGRPVPLAERPAGGEPTLGWVESLRFWRQSIYDHQQAIKRAGEEVGDHFILFPNGGHNRPESVLRSFRDSEYVMFELSVGDYGTNPGRVRSRIVDDLYLTVRNDNIWELKYTAAVRGRVSALLLTRGGYPSEKPAWVLNEHTMALGNAEAAAFGSGAGFLQRPRWTEIAPVQNRYRAFFEEHADLYAGKLPWAQVGIAAFGDQTFYENRAHHHAVEQLTGLLLEEHMLFDYVTEDRFTAAELAQYRVVIFPDITAAGPEQLAALRAYVAGGGHAVLIGKRPTRDLQLRPLDAARLPEALRVGEDALAERGGVRAWELEEGAGRWTWLDRVPPEELGDALMGQEAASLRVAPEAGPGVRLNAFIAPEAGSPLVVHVVNYDAPLGVEPGPLPEHENVALSVPLPEGAQVTGVTAFDPDGEPQDLAFQVGGERVHVTLPRLRIYAVVRIELG